MIKIETMQQIGTWIYQTRKSQRLTQERLAAISGVGIRFLRELEHGKETCEIGKILKVINFLGLDLYGKNRGEGLQ